MYLYVHIQYLNAGAAKHKVDAPAAQSVELNRPTWNAPPMATVSAPMPLSFWEKQAGTVRRYGLDAADLQNFAPA